MLKFVEQRAQPRPEINVSTRPRIDSIARCAP